MRQEGGYETDNFEGMRRSRQQIVTKPERDGIGTKEFVQSDCVRVDRDGYVDDMKKPTAVRCSEIGEDGER